MAKTEEKPGEKPKRKVNGRLFTKENAGAYAITAARAKTIRAQARHKLLASLVESDINLCEEFKKALKLGDEKRMHVVEMALKLVGLTFDQSEDGRAANLKITSNNKTENTVHVKVTGLDEGLEH